MLALFRVDSGKNIGAGHLGRCAALADALMQNGYQIIFVSRQIPHAIPITFFIPTAVQLWIERSHEFLPESVWATEEQAADARWIQDKFSSQSIDLLIVDHYGLDFQFESQVPAKQMLVLDDFYNRAHHCHFILNQAAHHQGAYQKLSRLDGCRELLGPKYALVAKDIRQAREHYHLPLPPHGILYLGSGNTGEFIYQILQTLMSTPRCPMTVILSDNDPFYEKIARLVQNEPLFSLHSYVQNFAALLQTASFFIGASGATSWERCCIGIPSVSFTLAANQEGIAFILNKHRAAVTFNQLTDKNLHLLKKTLEDFQDSDYLKQISDNARALCDGLGAVRIAQELMAAR